MKMMKISILTVILLSGYILISTSVLAQNSSNERFESFLLEFDSNFDFQVSRIKFPVMYIGLDDEYFMPDTTFIGKSDWKPINIYPDKILALDSRSQIYNNFRLELEDTDERVFSWYSIVGGMNMHYYYKRIEGKWYLVRIQDLST